MPPSPLQLCGSERPRVELAPPAVDSLGDEAADLAARAGLRLEPWQRDGLRTLLSVRPDGRWSCYEYGEICARQNGKTAMFLARALAGMFMLDEQLVLWSAHEVKTAMRSWRDLRRMLRTLGTVVSKDGTLLDVDGIPVKVNASNGQEGFERLDTEQEIRIVARSKGSGRGFSGDFVFIDEAFAYQEEHQDALMPTQAARPLGQIAYASSPPLDGRSAGPMYALRKRAERGDGGLGWRDWGLVDDLDEVLDLPPTERDAYLDDVARWAATNPALGLGRVEHESILRLRRSMSPRGFAREVLGLWPRPVASGGGWTVIPETVWRGRGGALGRPERGRAFALSASWPDARMGAIAVAGALGDELLVQVIEHRPGTAWMVERATELCQRWPGAACVLDPRGPAGHLRRELEEAGVELTTPGPTDVAHAFGRFYAATTEDAATLRHYDQPELDDAVRDAATRDLGDGRTWGLAKAGSGADLSPLTAATLAVGEAARRMKAPPPSPVAVQVRNDTADLMQIGF